MRSWMRMLDYDGPFSSKMIYLLVGLLVSLSATRGAVPNPRIVNGTNATEGEFPYVVSIRVLSGRYHSCGGSIIGERWILTAGHCISEYIETIKFGTIVLDEGRAVPSLDIDIANLYLHPGFINEDDENGNWLFANDIALLELEKDLPYGPNVQPIVLPEQDEMVPFNKTAVLVGWGYIDASIDEPDVLQKVNLTIYDNEYCEQYLTAPYNNTENLCAGVSGNDRGQCSGDSGGPLAVDGVQIGIVSWSLKPCITAPGVFTKVSLYRDWIKSVSGI